MRNIIILSVLALAACATPSTVLKNPNTGQIARCGGERSGSIVGGLLGYTLQSNDAEKCVKEFRQQGFKPE